MVKIKFYILFPLATLCLDFSLLVAQIGQFELAPPKAKAVAWTDTIFGDIRQDNYRWLRDKHDPATIKYLTDENNYAERAMAHTRGLQDTLYQEMRCRIKETDMSVPEKMGDYLYYYRTEQDQQYALFCRRRDCPSAPEEVLFNENKASRGHEYFEVGQYKLSPNQKMMAYTIDTTGSEKYNIHFMMIKGDKPLNDSIIGADNSVEWGNDNMTIFYLTLDESHRPYRLYRHHLGKQQGDDEVIYQEDDPKYSLELFKTRSGKYIVLHIASKSTTEERYLEADRTQKGLNLLSPREQGVEYYMEHQGRFFYLMTNRDAVNFRILRATAKQPGKWQEYIPSCDSVCLEGMDAFRKFLVVYERHSGLKKIRVIDFSKGSQHYVNFPEQDYSFWPGRNWEYDSEKLRYSYTSFITPVTVYDYNMGTRTKKVLKRQEILGGYNQDNYHCERIMVQAADGTGIPVSLVYKISTLQRGGNPLILNGYGAYGSSSDSYFSSTRLSLLNRGCIYAEAHVRGGGEMGRRWYDQGKLLNKLNTFTDFISCAESLISRGYTSSDRLIITGGSAGGLLIGAVVNMRPELFSAAVAGVPFVDVVNTMMDSTIPLTTSEYEEWGDPRDSSFYFYMKSYSPYENVGKKPYPNMLITAGLNDPRVGFWEPAKWTAKLREYKTDKNILLLKTNMGAGHMGLTGRFDYLKDEAFEYAFILNILSKRLANNRE
jgi:oligopeptidase B